ncbi:MAG: FAD-dependent oxidoreductase [Solirubrobacteraceae bacterium]
MAASDTQVAVIGGGVVGCAVAHALARRGVAAVLLEAEADLALGASGANSGVLHTGFDSTPGELETRLILRAAAMREELLEELGVTVWRCGARLTPSGVDERAAVARLAENARVNGVEVRLDENGSLTVPGESISDPAAFVRALASAAQAGGATVRLGARVTGLASAAGEDISADGPPGGGPGHDPAGDGLAVELETGERLRVDAAVNCAGLYADEIARSTGEDLLQIYPRKGEFLVFPAPQDPRLEQILLPVPSAMGKGVLVFPTLDRRAVIAGPTAREREDKRDWSVEADAAELILAKAQRMYPALEGLAPSAAYAGLRPAGRGANYVIERSRTLPRLIHVAAIRSTGLSASLAIGEHVVAMLTDDGAIAPGPVRALPAASSPASAGRPARPDDGPSTPETWWERAARHSQASAARSGLAGAPETP